MSKAEGRINIPYVDWENHTSPYYTERHKRWRQLCRKFVQKEMMPYVDKWEKQKKIPREIYKTCYDYGIYGARYPKKYGGTPFEGKPYDYFMHCIVIDEVARTASGGIFSSLFIQFISIPPVLHFGNEYHARMFEEVIRGDEIAALAISEGGHGSDVARIECTARREGDYYIINGDKKWISNGMSAKYFVTLVRTGTKESRHRGLSLVVIPRCKGVITARIMTQGHWTSHTTQIFFKDVKIPVKNLLGEENRGFWYTMYNFNQERYGIACQATCIARTALEESVKYARSRKVFDKPLIEAQVIRHKIAEMGRKILATYSFMERVSYQMQQDPLTKDPSIGASIALFKVQATKTLEFCARECAQIFGGKSYVLNSKADRIYRDVRAFAIYGGSEEIMLDVSTRLVQLSKSKL